MSKDVLRGGQRPQQAGSMLSCKSQTRGPHVFWPRTHLRCNVPALARRRRLLCTPLASTLTACRAIARQTLPAAADAGDVGHPAARCYIAMGLQRNVATYLADLDILL
jgi:hypothetical protein